MSIIQVLCKKVSTISHQVKSSASVLWHLVLVYVCTWSVQVCQAIPGQCKQHGLLPFPQLLLHVWKIQYTNINQLLTESIFFFYFHCVQDWDGGMYQVYYFMSHRKYNLSLFKNLHVIMFIHILLTWVNKPSVNALRVLATCACQLHACM